MGDARPPRRWREQPARGETADMRPPGDTAAAYILAERQKAGDDLQQQPDRREGERPDLKEERQEQHGDHHDEPRRGEQPGVAADHPRDRPRGTEQQRLDRADALVLVYPIYWWSFPAQLKGWIDRVFIQDWVHIVTYQQLRSSY